MFPCHRHIKRLATLPKFLFFPQNQPCQRHAFTTAAKLEARSGRPQRADLTVRRDIRKRRALETEMENLVKMALEHHKDSYTIAKFVRSVLKKGDRYEEALEVVRRASARKINCVVAWNHLIEYNLEQKRAHVALKTFTDMKRRGQLPNSQTYTIIFRGLGAMPNPKSFVAEAVKIYRLMTNNNRTPPNIIHLNALFFLCSRSYDLEMIYTLLADVTETGSLAPDSGTFTIVFNGLRAMYSQTSSSGSGKIEPSRLREERLSVVTQAKRIWADALRRWRVGRLTLDADMVCSMGRLLAVGDGKDVTEVFDLVQQTMDIPLPATASAYKNSEAEPTLTRRKGYALPDNNTLSMLLSACHESRMGWACYYWDLLASPPYNISPDADSYHQYLRVLRLAHASTKTFQLLMKMPPKYMNPITFRLAFVACLRDNKNPHCFENAGKILNIMQQTVQKQDTVSLGTYLRVAIHARRREYLQDGDVGLMAYARQLTRALERLWDSWGRAWDEAFGGAPLWDMPDLANEAVRGALRQERSWRLKKIVHERQKGYRVLDLKVMEAEDGLGDTEEDRMLQSRPQEGESQALAEHMKSFVEQREVVVLSRQMLDMFDRVMEIGGNAMTGGDFRELKKKRDRLSGRMSRFFKDRMHEQEKLPGAVRKAQLLRERLRTEQARARYQKPSQHRYTNV